MAMTLTQLERYMISEVENLHVKFDSAFAALTAQIQSLQSYMAHRFDSIDAHLDNHEARIKVLESK